ncbi:aminotransferase class III-fold pyridoxal phosphate-dependent enzyme [Thermococcus sp.]|uniref:aminotransferase class III-fold pyridoxal phosphate-dependent enzyme n=1 Tax=Thermococcus sp. TaxID=35749 RepID=UPI000F2230F2|nr:aminotransferase class III-fold pyridoxal phosphate-dependent enzyme [Thermococcus sp.]MCD6143334.1 aminotransferase class III-fold pyridoxal phosphate-dependent enzyme [Thermococcus sp.]RLF77052.1 MAG: aspartate aminotransferase family protein [Thermococci archaeon]
MEEDIKAKIKLIIDHTYGTWRAQKAWKSPLFITKAEGAYFWDHTGKRYLDFSSQLMCSNLGHGNKAIINAICEQAQKLPYVAPGFIEESKAKAVQALLEVMPENLEMFFFSTSGTEANEAAVKIARLYFEKEGKYKIISRYHSYHGATAASITLTGDPRRWWAERARTTIAGVRHAPDPYCYRCPFGLKYPECDLACVRYLDYMIKEEGNVAAVLLEPVVGTNGIIVPPKEYYKMVREICDENDVLFIVDEVMSGWYRTGKPFAIEHWGVVPDILTTAKGATGAYTPLGITATTREIRDYFEENVLSHGHTYAHHPLALSALPAAVEEYKKLFESGRLQKVSEYLGKRLYELAEDHPCVGDVRGLGHFWGLETVKNRETKEPFNVKSDKFVRPLMNDKIAAEARKRGLYVVNWYIQLLIAPPLTITKEQVDEAIDILDEALKVADKEAEKTDTPPSKSSEGIIY